MAGIRARDGVLYLVDNQDTEVLAISDLGDAIEASIVQLGDLAINDGGDILIKATTGTKVGQTTSKVGFYGATPVARATTYTLTYSTGSRTNSNLTASAPATTAAISTSPKGFSTRTQANNIAVATKALVADVLNIKQVLTQVTTDLKNRGFFA
jgi:hypothetical protein